MSNHSMNDNSETTDDSHDREKYQRVACAALDGSPEDTFSDNEHCGSLKLFTERDWQFIEGAVLPGETGYTRYQAECWATCVLERMRLWQISCAIGEEQPALRARIATTVFSTFPGGSQYWLRTKQLAMTGLLTKTGGAEPGSATEYEVPVGPWPDSSGLQHVFTAIRKADSLFRRFLGVWVLAVGASDEFDDQQLRDRYGAAGAGDIDRHRRLIDAIVSIELATSD